MLQPCDGSSKRYIMVCMQCFPHITSVIWTYVSWTRNNPRKYSRMASPAAARGHRASHRNGSRTANASGGQPARLLVTNSYRARVQSRSAPALRYSDSLKRFWKETASMRVDQIFEQAKAAGAQPVSFEMFPPKGEMTLERAREAPSRSLTPTSSASPIPPVDRATTGPPPRSLR